MDNYKMSDVKIDFLTKHNRKLLIELICNEQTHMIVKDHTKYESDRYNMPDITMCSSENCPMRGSCYRSRAKPDKLQSWTNFEYFCNENSGFDEYIKYNKERKNN